MANYRQRRGPGRTDGGARFAALLVAVFVGAFSAVFLWNGAGPRAAATGIEPLDLPGAPSAEQLKAKTWPHRPEHIDAQQPDFATPSSPAPTHASTRGRAVHFARCGGGARAACVVDGDTIWFDGAKIRMADYNTPEVSEPGCARERALGERATARLVQLLNSGAVAAHSAGGRDRDRYGRLLRVVTVDGASVGDTLVAEGLAHPWEGRRRDWC